MGLNSEKITIRLTPDQVEDIDSIMLKHDNRSRSQVIRMALENFISENLIDASSQKVVVHLPNNTINRLMDCVASGDALSLENAIHLSVDRFLNSIEEFYLSRWKQLDFARFDYQKNRAQNRAVKDSFNK